MADLQPDVFVVDQLSACVPLLRWLWPRHQRVLFYCHFPDQLLARRDEKGVLGLAKRLYRSPFDWLEGWSMGASDRVVVNSRFTKGVAERVFGSGTLGELRVVYPCVNTEAEVGDVHDEKPLWEGKKVLVSINRFETKKDLGLALKAYEGLGLELRRSARLVIAGGYDARVSENVQYHKELESLAQSLGLSHATGRSVPTALAIPADVDVLFLLSIPGPFKSTLLRNARLLIYTPTNEHFGIVPVEAMQHGVPVLAANTGGPLETVLDGKTGWLRDVQDVNAWTDVMRRVMDDGNAKELSIMGQNGKQRVRTEFSRSKMSERLDGEIQEMMQSRRKAFTEWKEVMIGLGVIGIFLSALVLTLVKTQGETRASRDSAKLVRSS